MFKRRHWLEVEKDDKDDDSSSDDESDLNEDAPVVSDGEDVSSEEESESSDSAESEDEISQKPGNTPKLKKFDIPNLKQLEPVSSLQEEGSSGSESEDAAPFEVCKCLACPKVLLLSIAALKNHILSKKHTARAKHLLKEGDDEASLILPAHQVTAMGNGKDNEEAETHAERAERMRKLANPPEVSASGEKVMNARKRKKAEQGRQRQLKRKQRRKEGRERKLAREAAAKDITTDTNTSTKTPRPEKKTKAVPGSSTTKKADGGGKSKHVTSIGGKMKSKAPNTPASSGGKSVKKARLVQ